MAEQLSVVLAEPRRRHVLSVLSSGRDHRSSFEELAIAVTAFERVADGAPDEPSSEVEISLYHCHLPKLAEVGVIRDDYREGEVTLTRTGRECADVLGVGQNG